jgi:lipid II:glycine glycyltransferase (peptidoglycan interpeptide bridge formation enzyme)
MKVGLITMHFTELSEKEYTSFLDNHPLKSFVQTAEMAKVKEKTAGNHILLVLRIMIRYCAPQ